MFIDQTSCFFGFIKLFRRIAIAPIPVEGPSPFHSIVLYSFYPNGNFMPASFTCAFSMLFKKFCINTAFPSKIFPLPGNTTVYKIPFSMGV